MTCTARPACTALSTAWQMASLVKKSPSAIDLVTRVKSWYTTRPAPRFMWPTSELPICPSGRPTSMPEPETRVRGAVVHRRSHTGVLAAMMAMDSGDSLCPKPSRIINTTGLGVAVIRLDSLYERGKECTAAPGRHAGASLLGRLRCVMHAGGSAARPGCVYWRPSTVPESYLHAVSTAPYRIHRQPLLAHQRLSGCTCAVDHHRGPQGRQSHHHAAGHGTDQPGRRPGRRYAAEEGLRRRAYRRLDQHSAG